VLAQRVHDVTGVTGVPGLRVVGRVRQVRAEALDEVGRGQAGEPDRVDERRVDATATLEPHTDVRGKG